MHVALVARTNLHRLHPSRLLNRHGKNKIPVRVGSVTAAESAASSAVRTRSGCPSRQPSTNFGCGGRSAGSPSTAPCSTQLLDQIDFGIRQAQLVGKLQLLRLRQPRRHGPRPRHVRDLPRMFLHVGISQQRKRCGLSRPVTRGARTKHDGSDVAIECNLRGHPLGDDWRGPPESAAHRAALASRISVQPAPRSQQLIPDPRCSIPLP